MLAINPNTRTGTELSLLKDAAKAEPTDQAITSSTNSQTAVAPEGVKVSLSTASLNKSAAESDPNRDIK
ncbi:hypothetical protein LCG56_02315 [Pseudomonas cannabina pv. alisalensis]|nr:MULTISPECIES: hypothetical protein [Pseudomonas syringae group]UBY98009.1 hypothetical protein LCG56_02315 [Pseudomonas cannabina pv. alisalensis]